MSATTVGTMAICQCGATVQFIGNRTWVDQQGQTHCPPVDGRAKYHRPAKATP